MVAKRVILVGGGFAGVRCAVTLRKAFSADELEVVLFNGENHMVFHPLLAEVAGGSIDAQAASAPLRQMLPGVLCRTEEVQRVDTEASSLEYEDAEGRRHMLSFDHLVLCCGNRVNLGLVPGMADHAFALKTVGDAIALRAHVMSQLERAEVCEDDERQSELLSFVIVGGGYSGVEVAGEINDLVRSSRRFFSNIDVDSISVTLIHSRDQLLPEISSSLRDFTAKKMIQSGVNVILKARAVVATSEGVGLKSGDFLKAGTIVCTIGSSTSEVVEQLDVQKERGRIKTRPDMRLVDHDSIWAAGDCALVLNGADGEPAPPTGQFADRQGRQLAANIGRVMRGEPTRPFAFKPLGQMCSIGHHSAVAEVFGMRLSGFFAWVLWRAVYLSKMPSFSKRVKLALDWTWQLIFPRDLFHLKADTTERVSRAYYQPGSFVFHEGDPATTFFAIESGEVEIVSESGDGSEEIVAVLGAGDFFGEMALINDSPRTKGVRARTAVGVVVMGREVFSQLSSSLAILRKLVEDAVRQRVGAAGGAGSADWGKLEGLTLGAMMQEANVADLGISLCDAAEKMAVAPGMPLCLVDEEGAFSGVVSSKELIEAMACCSSGQGLTVQTPLAELINKEAFCLCEEDAAPMALEAMNLRALRALPVVAGGGSRKLRGVVPIEALLGRMLTETTTSKA